MLSDSIKNVFRNTNNFLDPRLSESFENCLKIPKTVLDLRDFRELFKNSEDYLRIPRTVWDFQELFKNSENYLIGLDWNALFRVDKIVEKTKY